MSKKNPLKDIQEFYDKTVKEQDEKGCAELFKQATEAFIRNCKKEGFTLIDVEYLDGYYIFGHGSNSVIHFHIKEIPEWKFGIWWDQPENEEKRYFNGTLFAQYEVNIDKFKPSASIITESIFSVFNDDGTFRDPGVLSYENKYLLNYMKKEPYLSYYRDATGTNFNYEFVSRKTAKKKYFEDKAHRKKEVTLTEQYNKELIAYIYKVFKHKTKAEVYVYDRGDWISPRYEICGILPDSGEYEAGTYAIEDWYENVDKLLKSKRKKIEKKAEKEKIYYGYDVNVRFVYLMSREKFEKLKGTKNNEQ